MRINEIVQNLADAASLEDALEADELDVIDLHSLIENYIANCHFSHPDRQFEYWGTRNQALCRVSDLRIEQLLDKLIDNAVDFSEAGSTINIDLNTDKDNLSLSITNQGPSVPEDKLVSIFDSMVSIRSKEARLHIGMGLYVVRVIAEHHGGSVSATNLPDGNGVTVSVNLPLYNPVKHVIAASG
ncbi:MAG: ATP-binding protein, partial [Gammaproteobacteria bacterium]|nr:ATP-binding protein [Gammaproteobacteria bacterium]